MFKPTETMDGLIDITDQKATSPEPETMLDSVFNETMTPEEEYTQALLVCSTPEMTIDAYGMKLKVEKRCGEPIAEGEKELTCKDCACLSHRETLHIGVYRRWRKNEDGTVKVVDNYSFYLSLFAGMELTFRANSETLDFHRAFEKVLNMRDEVMKDFTLKDFLARNGAWCM